MKPIFTKLELLRHNGTKALVAIIFALFFGCQTSEETSVSMPNRPYHTFAINSMAANSPGSDPGAGARLAKPAASAVVSTMLAKGYSEARPAEADLLMKLHSEFKPDVLTETTEQRALTIEMIDRHTGKRVWTDTRARSSSQTVTPQELQKMISEMLAPFPAAAATAQVR